MSLYGSFKMMNHGISKKIPNWARLLFPMLLGGVLIYIFVHIMYFGGKRESLVAQGETALIRKALNFSNEPARKTDSNVIIISVANEDIPAIEVAPSKQLIDANIKEYASVVRHVASSDPKWIVVNWLTYAHPMSPEYLKPLTDVINELRIHDKVTIAVNYNAAGTMQPEFVQTYNIVEARDCYYDVNLFCTLLDTWTWMPQQVMNRFFKNRPNWHVSKNLPHSLPNILLNLPDPKTLRHQTFLDFRPPVMSDIPKGSIVFIGNAVNQSVSFRANKDAIQRTFIAASDAKTTLQMSGIPWHEFWAAMTQMFIEEKTVAVVPDGIGWAIMLIVFMGIITCIKIFGGRSFIPIAVGTVLLLFLNCPLVYFFRIYLPVMPIVIAEFVAVTSAVFIVVTYSSYKKWRLKAAEDLAESTADIKQNFIHLISHNLNTPIAQLRGLLEILSSELPSEGQIIRASKLLELIRLTVRAVLNTTTMANQELKWQETGVRQFFHDFLDRECSFFGKSGISIVMTPSEDDEDKGDIWFFKFVLDRELVQSSLLYGMALLAMRFSTQEIRVFIRPVFDEPADPQGLIVTLSVGKEAQKVAGSESNFAISALTGFLDMAQRRGIFKMTDSEHELIMQFSHGAPT